MPQRTMVLSAFLQAAGYDARSWRLPGSRSEELGSLGVMAEIAQRYEQAKLDSVFIADTLSTNPILSGDVKLAQPYEPLTTLSALAAVTERIGLIGTFSTTWNHPYTLARQLAALDSLSEGRAGWNIVTSSRAGENYGAELPDKPTRYRRAAEFVSVVTDLWSAWSDDAVINDREAGLWVDPQRIRPIDHAGEFFRIRGFTNQRRSPQGHPVLVQAGQSTGGRDLGATVADVIYTVQPIRGAAIEYYAAYKQNVVAHGRDPNHTLILPGLVPYVGATEAEATEMQRSLAELLDFDEARKEFAAQYALDLDDVDLDERIPAERFEGKDDDSLSRISTFRNLVEQEGMTLREVLVSRFSVGGHRAVAGTASQIADTMIDWFESRACDGFSLNAPLFPDSVDQICRLLVPELQERGYFREEYEATTFRGHLGLPVPDAWDRIPTRT